MAQAIAARAVVVWLAFTLGYVAGWLDGGSQKTRTSP